MQEGTEREAPGPNPVRVGPAHSVRGLFGYSARTRDALRGVSPQFTVIDGGESDKSAKSAKSTKSDKSSKSDKSTKSCKSGRSHKSAKTHKSGQSDKSAKGKKG